MKKLLFLLILSWQSIDLAMETDFSLKESIKGTSPLSLKNLSVKVCAIKNLSSGIKEVDETIQEMNNYKNNPTEGLLNALKNGDNDSAAYWIWHGANLHEQNKNTKKTAIKLAAMNTNSFILDLLSKKGIPIVEQDDADMTPLHYAVLNGNVDTTRYLIEKLNDINLVDENGCTPYDLAYNLRNENIEKLFLNKTDTQNPKIVSSQDLFFLVVKWGAKKTIENFIQNKKIDVNGQDFFGMTALHWASMKGLKEVVELLLDNKTDANIKNNEGITALHLASLNGHVEATKLLLTCDADINSKNNNGETALHWASEYGNKEIVKLLWKKTYHYSKLLYVIKNNPIKTTLALTLPIFGTISYWYWRK